MRVVSANINGIAAAHKNRFFDWLVWQGADVVCLQELNTSAISADLTAWFARAGYEIAAAFPEGRSGGTAILSKTGFDDIETSEGTGHAEFGQYIAATIGPLRVASVYIKLGNNEVERQLFSSRFASLAQFEDALICGDFNIIGGKHDSDMWYPAQPNGYRDEERAWLNGLIGESWTDALRASGAGAEGNLYTWWSRHAGRFESNRGTRLDYQLSSPMLTARIVPNSGKVFREHYHGLRITDHGPITIDYSYDAESSKI